MKRRPRGANDLSTGATADRPIQLSDMNRAVLKELDTPIEVQLDGRKQQVPAHELLIKKTKQMAFNGSPHAMNKMLTMWREADDNRRRQLDQSIAEATAFKALQQSRLETAIANGEPIDHILPHPDDILIREGKGDWVLGPVDEEGLVDMKLSMAIRDTFVLQHVYEKRVELEWCSYNDHSEPSKGDDISHDVDHGEGRTVRGSALPLAMLWDHRLPKRVRLSDAGLLAQIARHERKTKRELLSELTSAWQLCKMPQPRGWITPPLGILHDFAWSVLPAVERFAADVEAGIDPNIISYVQSIYPHIVRSQAMIKALDQQSLRASSINTSRRQSDPLDAFWTQ